VLRRSVKNLGLGSNSEFGDHLYTMERGFYPGDFVVPIGGLYSGSICESQT
jgi:hypothetical protein